MIVRKNWDICSPYFDYSGLINDYLFIMINFHFQFNKIDCSEYPDLILAYAKLQTTSWKEGALLAQLRSGHSWLLVWPTTRTVEEDESVRNWLECPASIRTREQIYSEELTWVWTWCLYNLERPWRTQREPDPPDSDALTITTAVAGASLAYAHLGETEE